MPAILVPRGKPVEQVFDGAEPDALEIGRAARPDALQILERAASGSINANAQC